MITEPACKKTYDLVCEAMRNARENGDSLILLTDEVLADDLMDCDADIAECDRESVLDAVAIWRNTHTQF